MMRSLLRVCVSTAAPIVLAASLAACGSAPPAPAVTATSAPPTAVAVATAVPVAATATSSPPTATVAAATATNEPTKPAATATTVATPAATATTAAAPVIASAFQIDPAQSQASFTINEELFGSPTTVVGSTPDVSGVISVTMGDLSQTTIGPIRINARDLRTDEEMRNRAIRAFILQSSKDEYQYITFEPTAIEGLPADAKAGAAVTFKVTGNLKIRDIVKLATFEVTVTAKSEAELSGTAKTTVKRSDFELNIPSVPAVANVTDEVELAFTFVAKK